MAGTAGRLKRASQGFLPHPDPAAPEDIPPFRARSLPGGMTGAAAHTPGRRPFPSGPSPV
jgi:hypothetical protein